ncbi:MAG: Rap1a/Tai family immunity protein [Alcaligenaceae bacterium]
MKKQLALLCLAIASATCAAQQAPVASTTTEKFVGLCANTSDSAAQNFCHGFGQGVYETYLISRHPKTAPNFVCAQNSTLTRQQHIDNFMKWSESRPQFKQASAADTILRYLGETFPCKP